MENDHIASINYTLPVGKTWQRAGEVAAYLDIARSSVFRLIKAGEIPSRRFGHTARILRAAILASENRAEPCDQNADSEATNTR